MNKSYAKAFFTAMITHVNHISEIYEPDVFNVNYGHPVPSSKRSKFKKRSRNAKGGK